MEQRKIVKQGKGTLAELDGATSKGVGTSKKSSKKSKENAATADATEPKLQANFLPWLGIPFFGSNSWDLHRKWKSDFVSDSGNSGWILFLKSQCLENQKIGILICEIQNSGNLFGEELITSHCC